MFGINFLTGIWSVNIEDKSLVSEVRWIFLIVFINKYFYETGIFCEQSITFKKWKSPSIFNSYEEKAVSYY